MILWKRRKGGVKGMSKRQDRKNVKLPLLRKQNFVSGYKVEEKEFGKNEERKEGKKHCNAKNLLLSLPHFASARENEREREKEGAGGGGRESSLKTTSSFIFHTDDFLLGKFPYRPSFLPLSLPPLRIQFDPRGNFIQSSLFQN